MKFELFVEESMPHTMFNIIAELPGDAHPGPYLARWKAWDVSDEEYYEYDAYADREHNRPRRPYNSDYDDDTREPAEEYKNRFQSGKMLFVMPVPITPEASKKYQYDQRVINKAFREKRPLQVSYGVDVSCPHWFSSQTPNIVWKIVPIQHNPKMQRSDKRMLFLNRFYMDLALQLPRHEWMTIRKGMGHWGQAFKYSADKYEPTKEFSKYYMDNVAVKNMPPKASVLYRAIPKFVEMGFMEAKYDNNGDILFKLTKSAEEAFEPENAEQVYDKMIDLF